jgi:TPR repeat protein
MMHFNVRRVAAGSAAAVRNKFVKEAEELCASGQFAAALVPLQQAIDLGHLPSRALKAWLLGTGRQDVPKDYDAALELANEGARLGCHHCQGVMACLTHNDARSLTLARESANNGSMYGQWMLGQLQQAGVMDAGALPAVAYFRLAAAQGLDAAQCSLGDMYRCGDGVVPDYAEALRFYHVAAF